MERGGKIKERESSRREGICTHRNNEKSAPAQNVQRACSVSVELLNRPIIVGLEYTKHLACRRYRDYRTFLTNKTTA